MSSVKSQDCRKKKYKISNKNIILFLMGNKIFCEWSLFLIRNKVFCGSSAII